MFLFNSLHPGAVGYCQGLKLSNRFRKHLVRSYNVYSKALENLKYAKMTVMWFLPLISFCTKHGRAKIYSENNINAFHIFDTFNIDTTYTSVLYIITSLKCIIYFLSLIL